MMFRLLFVVAVFVLYFSVPGAQAQEERNPAINPYGLWLTENERSVIDVYECEGKLCGKVHWIIAGGMQTDSKNPDEALRNRPICGLQIMWGLEPDEDDPEEWEDGQIYKADDGDIYDVDIEMEDAHTMEVTGYLGITLFGKSQVWKRVTPENYPACGA